MANMNRRSVLAGLSAFAAIPAWADGPWPSRPIMLVHGFVQGGPVDTMSRILADELSKRLGQQVVVDAKPGATGTIAAQQVARAAPDGYTLTTFGGSFAAASATLETLSFNPAEAFTFISTAAEYPLVLVTHPDSEIRTVADVISLAHSRSSPLQYGTAGVGSTMHLCMELFAKKADLRLQHIPYRGGMPAITDLLGKRLDLVLDPPTVPVPFVRDGKLRALAVTSASRFFALPEAPTMIESGLDGFDVTAYLGIAAPAGLPKPITAKINSAVAAVLSQPAIIEKLNNLGSTPRPSSPDEYKARFVAEVAKWKVVVADAQLGRL